MTTTSIIIRKLGIQPYTIVEQAMKVFTNKRNNYTTDEIWLVQHYKVFTQGYAGDKKHLLNTDDIPVIQSIRGGQVTYHGPGQQIMYILLDLKRLKIKLRTIISILENAVIKTLSYISINATNKKNYPGIYIKKKKICSIGLTIKKNCSLHGLALNINMDLSPFTRINPCGQIGLQMTQINDFLPNIKTSYIINILVYQFLKLLKIPIFILNKWNIEDYII